MESYYIRFYKLMNEMIKNNLNVTTVQVNVQFLQQLQPKWSKFVTIVKQQHKLDKVSYHKLFDILKQYQNEVNELRAKKLARNANPLALVAAAQADRELYYQTSRKCILSGPYKPTTILVQAVDATDDSLAVPEHTTVATPTNMSSKNKDHFIAEKEAIHLILTGIGDDIYSTDVKTNLFWEFRKFTSHEGESMESYYIRFYKLMNEMIKNNLNVTTVQDNDPEQAQRDKDMQKNLALISKYFKKIYKPTNNNLRTSSNSKNKNVDTTLRFKNDDHFGQFGIQRTVNVAGTREKYDWLADTDKEVDEQELEAHYSYMAKIQKNEQNNVDSDDERVALANLKLDVDENKKIQNQLNKANTTLAQELKECKTILAETSKSLGESISVRDSCLVALQTKQTEFEKYKAFNDCTVDYDKLERKLNKVLGQLAHKDTIIKEGLKTKAYELLVVKENHDELMNRSLLTKSHYEGIVKQKMKNDSFKFVHELKQEMHADFKYVESLEKEIDELESDKAKFLNMYDEILQQCISKDVMCSYLMSLSDLVVLD
nr:hypothetical protein [Tanacetum cinerariifolium]